MKCPKCNVNMQLDSEYFDPPKSVMYACPVCGYYDQITQPNIAKTEPYDAVISAAQAAENIVEIIYDLNIETLAKMYNQCMDLKECRPAPDGTDNLVVKYKKENDDG